MSGHHAPPGPPPRHTTRLAIASSPGRCPRRLHLYGHEQHPGVRAGRGQHRPRRPKPTLTGAGSTFDAPFFSAAFARYQQQHPGVTISYSAVGSSAGIAAFSAGQVDFGASDVPMTDSRAGRRDRRPGHPGTSCPGRRRHRLQPVPTARGPAAPDRPGAGPASSSGRSPVGTTRPSPPSTPPSPSRPRRSPSSTAPKAAAPPTSSATTCPRWTRPGRPESAPARH